jgi:hypothetical protein
VRAVILAPLVHALHVIVYTFPCKVGVLRRTGQAALEILVACGREALPGRMWCDTAILQGASPLAPFSGRRPRGQARDGRGSCQLSMPIRDCLAGVGT